MENLPKPALKENPEEELVAIYTLTREQLLALGLSESAINGLPEPEFKVRPKNKEPNETGVTMNDLPELPFEKILGYLSLHECIKYRAVSRRWCKTIDSLRPKSLCYSKQPSDFIYGKNRWASGDFARNFVNSARFDLFFKTFGQSILSNLKHLRLCEISLEARLVTPFDKVLNSFGQLEQLDIIQLNFGGCNRNREFELNLPMLNSFQIVEVDGINRLALDAPKLKNLKIGCGLFLNLHIVCVESVEKLITWNLENTNVKNLKNLKYLYTSLEHTYRIDPTFISGLEQLKEIHLFDRSIALRLFEQKERYGRVDLKIYLRGRLLSGPNDPVIDSFAGDFGGKTIAYLAEHPDRLADQILFCPYLDYSVIEDIPRGSEISILNRFTDLCQFTANSPVQDIERFLDILKSLDNIAELRFARDQPQELFDRLPDYCAIQRLAINSKPADFGFLYRLSHLIELELKGFEINVELIRKILEELKFLSLFYFKYLNNSVVVQAWRNPNQFSVGLGNNWTEIPDLDSFIHFFVQRANK